LSWAMCTGIALPLYELPTALHGTPEVAPRIHVRGELEEVQFHWWNVPAVLPVRWHGRIQLLRWGSKSRRSRLPLGGWIPEERIESGRFAGAEPEPVIIPAVLGHHSGMWFVINTGIRGAVICDAGGPVVYMLTKRSTNYYRNMTEQAGTMPVFVDQVI